MLRRSSSGADVIETPEGHAPPQPETPFPAFIVEQQDLALEFGDLGGKILVVLPAIALIRWLP